MTPETTPIWIHPMDFVRRRRWTGTVAPHPRATRPETPRIA